MKLELELDVEKFVENTMAVYEEAVKDADTRDFSFGLNWGQLEHLHGLLALSMLQGKLTRKESRRLGRLIMRAQKHMECWREAVAASGEAMTDDTPPGKGEPSKDAQPPRPLVNLTDSDVFVF